MKEKIKKFFEGEVTLNLGKKTISVSKKLLSLVLAGLIVLGTGTYFLTRKDNKDAGELITALVTKGDVNSVIEGTGVIAAINQYEITSLAKGDVIADYFEEGDYVEKDMLLYEIDSSTVASNIERAQSSFEKAQMAYDNSIEDLQNLNIRADISGVITELNIKKGNNVSNGHNVATITDSENLILTIPFTQEDAKQLSVGESAQISLESSFTTLSGTVSRVGTGAMLNSYGVKVTNVEIRVKNPGAVSPGDKATAIVGDYACNDAGTFEYENESVILAKVSGKAIRVPYKKGDKVSKGSVIAVLESTSVTSNAKSSRLSLNDAQSSLEDTQENLEDYRITAPISGKVIEKNIKAGEKLDTNSASTMAIISDLSSLVFEMSIDELDINKIKIGQKVNITADAVENKVFQGEVTNISIVGSSTQGVTSYPVKVTIAQGENSGLIPGMNVTGQIVVESVTDVIRVPVSAVRRGNFVIVKDDKTVDEEKSNKIPSETDDEEAKKRIENMKNQLEVPKGYTIVQVETGISDENFIEIKSGLKEGQTVLLPDTTQGYGNYLDNMMQMMHGGGMPSGGGMPGGGMQGGDQRSNR